jgi:hypothetical protein
VPFDKAKSRVEVVVVAGSFSSRKSKTFWGWDGMGWDGGVLPKGLEK